MEPSSNIAFSRIENWPETVLVGSHKPMTLSKYEPHLLWQTLMPLRNQIPNRLGSELISMTLFAHDHDFSSYNPEAQFEKWAAVMVSEASDFPTNLFATTMPSGPYAVFHYRGDANGAYAAFKYIFTEWFPASNYQIDQRPHFEVLGDKYRRNDPNSEEEFWIPVRLK